MSAPTTAAATASPRGTASRSTSASSPATTIAPPRTCASATPTRWRPTGAPPAPRCTGPWTRNGAGTRARSSTRTATSSGSARPSREARLPRRRRLRPSRRRRKQRLARVVLAEVAAEGGAAAAAGGSALAADGVERAQERLHGRRPAELVGQRAGRRATALALGHVVHQEAERRGG